MCVPGVRRMTDMVMSEQTNRMTNKAMAIPFQFLWGGLTPPRSYRERQRQKELIHREKKSSQYSGFIHSRNVLQRLSRLLRVLGYAGPCFKLLKHACILSLLHVPRDITKPHLCIMYQPVIICCTQPFNNSSGLHKSHDNISRWYAIILWEALLCVINTSRESKCGVFLALSV